MPFLKHSVQEICLEDILQCLGKFKCILDTDTGWRKSSLILDAKGWSAIWCPTDTRWRRMSLTTSYPDTETSGTPLTLAKNGGQLYVPDHFISGNRALWCPSDTRYGRMVSFMSLTSSTDRALWSPSDTRYRWMVSFMSLITLSPDSEPSGAPKTVHEG